MPRLAYSLPRYRRHRGSNQAVVTLNSRDYYLGPYGTKASRVEYDRLIGEWLAGGRYPLHVTASDLTIVELCVRYLEFAKTTTKATTLRIARCPVSSGRFGTCENATAAPWQSSSVRSRSRLFASK